MDKRGQINGGSLGVSLVLGAGIGVAVGVAVGVVVGAATDNMGIWIAMNRKTL